MDLAARDKLFDANSKLVHGRYAKVPARLHAVLRRVDHCEQQIVHQRDPMKEPP